MTVLEALIGSRWTSPSPTAPGCPYPYPLASEDWAVGVNLLVTIPSPPGGVVAARRLNALHLYLQWQKFLRAPSSWYKIGNSFIFCRSLISMSNQGKMRERKNKSGMFKSPFIFLQTFSTFCAHRVANLIVPHDPHQVFRTFLLEAI